ncbi:MULTISPECIES: hypothetical protein [unclassified Leifsonia]|uniref:hypothetical protein n=1 Tax=unclassified Leifsonia TaxID=2663824 RepID=UPI0008A778F7|nr:MULTISPECIES: hypothetical protein [unclassified Leifsonia]SEI13365.1 hypothetical protein SAMN04515694_11920 [Leifsonia sp. CL154]SFL98764.1 hypothetical protein SAMN04515692_12020 [Leifsonia sp. CL147]
MSDSSQGLLKVTRILGGIVLLAIAGIHLFLVFDGVGGVLGVLFILNSIAAIVLAIGMFALRGALVTFVVVLSLLFIIASLISLLLALTVGLFGIHETWTFTLVPETIIVEAIGILVLVVASAAALRRRARRAV